MHRRTILAILFTLMMAAMPLVAGAAIVYEGQDYAYNNRQTNVVVCDMESDGNPAYTNYTRPGSGGVFKQSDPNGSQAGCGQTPNYGDILAYRVCEGQWGDDPCSQYVKTT